jgi:hypothetical protein
VLTSFSGEYRRRRPNVKQEPLILERLDQILGRHQLLEKWEKFGDKFLKNE